MYNFDGMFFPVNVTVSWNLSVNDHTCNCQGVCVTSLPCQGCHNIRSTVMVVFGYCLVRYGTVLKEKQFVFHK